MPNLQELNNPIPVPVSISFVTRCHIKPLQSASIVLCLLLLFVLLIQDFQPTNRARTSGLLGSRASSQLWPSCIVIPQLKILVNKWQSRLKLALFLVSVVGCYSLLCDWLSHQLFTGPWFAYRWPCLGPCWAFAWGCHPTPSPPRYDHQPFCCLFNYHCPICYLGMLQIEDGHLAPWGTTTHLQGMHRKKSDGGCTFYHNTLRTKLSLLGIWKDMI